MKGVRWLTSAAIIAIQEELIGHYGGMSGLRAPESQESAIARPKYLASNRGDVTVPQLAASYTWGLLRNHPFTDGNQPIALAAAVVFLELNGWELVCGEAEETAMVLQAAEGEISEPAWSRWLQRSANKKSR